MSDVRDAFEDAVEAADHLTESDAGTIAAARALADKIDAWDVIVQWAKEDASESGDRPTVPHNDNVTLPTFLKFLDALGLTPIARQKLDQEDKGASGGNKLAQLQAKTGLRAV